MPAEVEVRGWGRGGSVVALSLAYHFKNGAYSCSTEHYRNSVLEFSHKLSKLGSCCSCLFRLSVHSQQLSSPWVHCPNSTFQHPSLFSPTDTQLNLVCNGLLHRPCVQFFLCPAFHRLGVMFPCNSSNIPSCSS